MSTSPSTALLLLLLLLLQAQKFGVEACLMVVMTN
jgi:hypothetical protein